MNINNKPKSEFDNYGKEYKKLLAQSFPSFLNSIDYFSEYKVKHIFKHRKNMKTETLLDFGCGVGLSLKFFSKYFPKTKLWGWDISSVSLKQAKQDFKAVNFTDELKNVPKNYFSTVFAANVFHHIEKKDQIENILFCKNFLKPDGLLYIIEHNPFNPVTRMIFNKSPLDKNATMISLKDMVKLANLAKMKIVRKKYISFFPRKLSFLNFLEKLINWMPIGAQYIIILKK